MILPENGSVILIDDEIDEALPIINVLSNHNISVKYYDGKKNMPSIPLKNIRCVFLDMRFSSVSDSKTVVSNLMGILNAILDLNNGPYVLFVWSKHDSLYLSDFVQTVEEDKDFIAKPITIVSIDKQECLSVINEVGIDHIYRKIENGLKLLNGYKLFFMWENIIAKAAANTVTKITSDCTTLSDDDARLQASLFELAQAYVGVNNLLTNGAEIENGIIAKNAILSLNEILPDEVNNLIANGVEYYQNIKLDGRNQIIVDDKKYSLKYEKGKYIFLENEKIIQQFKNLEKLFTFSKEIEGREHLDTLKNKEYEILSSLNTKILLTSDSNTLKPGSVFTSDLVNTDFDNLKRILKFDKDDELEGVKKIEVEISPSCDYAQQKWEQYRLLQGYYMPYSIYVNVKEKLSADSYYHSPVFKDHENMFVFVFNLKVLRTCEVGKNIGERYLYSIKDNFLHEIRNKFGQHFMRVGIMQFK